MTAAAIAKKLGGRRVLRRRVTSDVELAEVVRAGLPVSALDRLLEEMRGAIGSRGDLFRIIGTERTLQRKRAAGTPLSADESDRLARLARLVVRAEEALGDAEKAHRWLTRPNRALGGREPLTLLDSDAGTLAVERVLGRIEHGVYS